MAFFQRLSAQSRDWRNSLCMAKRRAAGTSGGAAGGARCRSRSRDVSSPDESGESDALSEVASPEVLPPGGCLPPLPEDGILRLVERTAALGLHFPKKADNFAPEDARIAYKAHLEKWGLHKREPRARGAVQREYVYRTPPPPFESCVMQQDLSDKKLRELLALPFAERAKKLPIYASAAAEVNEQLAGRNFLEQALVYMNDDSTLPPPVEMGDISSSEDEQQPQERRTSKRQGRLLPPLAPSLVA